MKRLITVFFAYAVQCASGAPAETNIRPIHTNDPEMNAATARAQRTLNDFLGLKAKQPADTSGFILKVRFGAPPNVEHMWVSPFRADGKGGFTGLLKSIPQYVPGLAWGQEVNFVREQVSDWGYTQNGKRIGYFTTCVLLARDPTLRKEVAQQQLRYECAA